MLNIQRIVCNMFQENCYIVSDDTKECVIIDCGAFYEEEKKEIDKILRKLTAEISEFEPQLSDYQNYIFDLDLTRAKAKFAENTCTLCC